MNMKTLMISTVAALALTTATVSADTFLSFSPTTVAVDGGAETAGIGFGLGTDVAEYGAFAVAVEAGLTSELNDTWTLDAIASADLDVAEFSGVNVTFGGFGGVEFADVANFDVDANAWVYGVQASVGNDDVALRTRFYLEDMDNVAARIALTLNF